MRGDQQTGAQWDHGNTCAQTTVRPPMLEGGCRSPSEGEEHANQWEISVTIRHRLLADLNQADDGHERAQEPAPSERQPGESLPLAPGEEADARERQCGTEHD